VVPEALPKNGVPDATVFRARVGDVTRRASILWAHDNAPYSLTQLTAKLSDEHGMVWLRNNIYVHWRIAGQRESMWDAAERLTRPESDEG
jgi:hypothetical protein